MKLWEVVCLEYGFTSKQQAMDYLIDTHWELALAKYRPGLLHLLDVTVWQP